MQIVWSNFMNMRTGTVTCTCPDKVALKLAPPAVHLDTLGIADEWEHFMCLSDINAPLPEKPVALTEIEQGYNRL